ncbi:cysteinyl-tRNA synthetase [Xylariaceae sp. FL0255]|nr:cysteinyl-tRNA synthetase [Xylariaceae sp. FL0255]
MASETPKQMPWQRPLAQSDARLPRLKIYNSLTRKKDNFVPIDATGKTVTWYACGPTVYEDAHLGHAKNYISTDIIRRILKDYFGYQVKFVMNTTDIDDKIIVKGRQQHLLERFKLDHVTDDGSVSNSVLKTTRAAFQHYINKNLPSFPLDTSPESFAEAVDKTYKKETEPVLSAGGVTEKQHQPVSVASLLLRVYLETAGSAVEALQAPGKLPEFHSKTDDILLPYLDALHGPDIDSDDHGIYLELSQKFEGRFFEDMKALNILAPDHLTRVTEYVPQIISFVEKIVANGFGYATADGSVYFDIDSFEKAGHSYSQLEPWNKNNRALQTDGEGSLSKGKSVKLNENHFALWKASKPGEPAWPSPWGRGRPGWHIECSAMASEVIGKTMDIHSGGVDLRFPHHDNELAQSEAYWSTTDCHYQWVKYFIHMGQLRIRGLKMSKSLKNYTTIRAVLSDKEWTVRSLRICFLLMPWQDGIEVTDELMKAVVSWEGKLNNFFLKSRDIWKQSSSGTAKRQKLGAKSQELLRALDKAKTDVDEALCDSFNTSAVMRILSDVVTEANSAEVLSDIPIILLAWWVTRIVTIFGLVPEGDLHEPGRIGWSGLDIPEPAKPYIYPASRLRDEIRVLACSSSVDHTAIVKLTDEIILPESKPIDESSKPYEQILRQFSTDVKTLASQEAPAKNVLALCDQLRDVHLWNLGIYLEDRNNSQPALVRPLDKSLIEARAEREAICATKARIKLAQETREAERERALSERAKVNPRQMFKNSDEYSDWDNDGIPTKDAGGNPISKTKRKKLAKEWEMQRKNYEELRGTQPTV